jgi:hypothetical protein
MTPARRERIRVYQRKIELQAWVRERVLTQSEASQLLTSYTQRRNELRAIEELSFVSINETESEVGAINID